MLKDSPDLKHFCLLLFAGHGMINNGVQCFVLNQFSRLDQWYKLIAVEIDIRSLSKQCKNSYQVSVFACCRENFTKALHSGCVEAESPEEATKKFEQMQAERKLEEEKKQTQEEIINN